MKPIVAKDISVFLIDDDRAMISSTAQWLSLSGLTVRTFLRPTDFLRHMRFGLPAIVVSDIRMPDMDGMELLKTIRRTDPEIPAILITGHGDVPLAVRAMKEGAFEFLTKPFQPERLLQFAENAIEIRVTDINNRIQQQVSVDVDAETQVPNRNDQTHDHQPLGKLVDQMDNYERSIIEAAIRRHDGRIPPILKELDLPRRTLNAKMKKYGILRKPIDG